MHCAWTEDLNRSIEGKELMDAIIIISACDAVPVPSIVDTIKMISTPELII